MVSKHKKVVIIGETKFCTQCAEYLISNGWKIVYVISDDGIVIDRDKDDFVLPVHITHPGKIFLFLYLFSEPSPHLRNSMNNKNVIRTHQNLLNSAFTNSEEHLIQLQKNSHISIDDFSCNISYNCQSDRAYFNV